MTNDLADDLTDNSSLCARGVCLSYTLGVDVVHEVDLRLDQGTLLALVGPNGAGKSTLLKALAGLKAPDAGAIVLANEDLSKMDRSTRARMIAYLPQSVHLEFSFTVREVVAMGRHPYVGPLGFLSPRDVTWVEECMAFTETFGLASRFFMELSGGERQRVLLASVLAQAPRFLLLDEPTVSLDLQHQAGFMELLRRFARDGQGVLMVTHDVNLAGQYCDRIILIHHGRIVREGKPESVLKSEYLREIYGDAVTVIRNTSNSKPVVFVQARGVHVNP